MNSFYWAILAAITWGCVPLLEKLGLMRVDVYSGLFFRCLGVMGGAILLLIFKSEILKSSTNHEWLGIFYLISGGFLASFIGQIFFYNALKTGEASKVVPLAGAYPLISFLLGILFLGEKLSLVKASGIVFILLGVFLLK